VQPVDDADETRGEHVDIEPQIGRDAVDALFLRREEIDEQRRDARDSSTPATHWFLGL
jgi:hypothetical protein